MYAHVWVCLCRQGSIDQGSLLMLYELPDGDGVSRRGGHKAGGSSGHPCAQAFREEASWRSLRPGAPLWVKPSLHLPYFISFRDPSVPTAFITSDSRGLGEWQKNKQQTRKGVFERLVQCAAQRTMCRVCARLAAFNEVSVEGACI